MAFLACRVAASHLTDCAAMDVDSPSRPAAPVRAVIRWAIWLRTGTRRGQSTVSMVREQLPVR